MWQTAKDTVVITAVAFFRDPRRPSRHHTSSAVGRQSPLAINFFSFAHPTQHRENKMPRAKWPQIPKSVWKIGLRWLPGISLLFTANKWKIFRTLLVRWVPYLVPRYRTWKRRMDSHFACYETLQLIIPSTMWPAHLRFSPHYMVVAFLYSGKRSKTTGKIPCLPSICFEIKLPVPFFNCKGSLDIDFLDPIAPWWIISLNAYTKCESLQCRDSTLTRKIFIVNHLRCTPFLLLRPSS